MALSFFGSDGAYSMNQAANQSQNMLNTYFGSSSSSTGTAVSSINLGYYGALQPVMGQNIAATQSLTEYIKQVSAPAKKAAHGVLAKLKEEIDGWHGDILERCPA